MPTIRLTKGYVALVDAADYAELSQYNWQARPGGSAKHVYASRRHGNGMALMHRQLFDFPAGMDVHHVNGDTLDNRRSNLQVVTRSYNLAQRRAFKTSKTGMKGVHKHGDKWQMVVSKLFDTLDEAAAARARVAAILFDE